MKKKLLIVLLAIVLCFTLTACGEKKESPNKESSNNGGSETTKSTGKLEDASEQDYIQIVQKTFGIDPIAANDLVFDEIKAYPKSITISWRISDEAKKDSFTTNDNYLTEYFNRCLKVSETGKIYRRTNGLPGEGYTSLEAFTSDDSFPQEWYYKYDGRSVKFGMSIDFRGVLELMLSSADQYDLN